MSVYMFLILNHQWVSNFRLKKVIGSGQKRKMNIQINLEGGGRPAPDDPDGSNPPPSRNPIFLSDNVKLPSNSVHICIYIFSNLP
jgi:hypothetical protein